MPFKTKDVICPDCHAVWQGKQRNSLCPDCRRQHHNATQRANNRRWRKTERARETTQKYRERNRRRLLAYAKNYRLNQKKKHLSQIMEAKQS